MSLFLERKSQTGGIMATNPSSVLSPFIEGASCVDTAHMAMSVRAVASSGVATCGAMWQKPRWMLSLANMRVLKMMRLTTMVLTSLRIEQP
jgi:hypothetical protein